MRNKQSDWVKPAIIAYVILVLGDMFLTWQQVSYAYQEGNPILRGLYRSVGDWAWLIACVVALIFAFALYLNRGRLIAHVILIIALLLEAWCFNTRFWSILN